MDQPEARKQQKRKKRKSLPTYGPWDTRTPLQKIQGDNGWTDILPLPLWLKIFHLKKKAQANWVKDVGFVRFGDKVMCATPYGIPDTNISKTRHNKWGPMLPAPMAERLHDKFVLIFMNSKRLGWRGMGGVSRYASFTLGDQNGLKRRLFPYKLEKGKSIQYVLNLNAFKDKVDEDAGYETKEDVNNALMSVLYPYPREKDRTLDNLKPWPKDQAPPRFVIDLSLEQNALERMRAM